MKSLTVLILYGFLCSCNGSFNKNDSKHTVSKIKNDDRPRNDTTVGVVIHPSEISTPDYTVKEYFVIVNGDTSNTSLVISFSNISGNISSEIAHGTQKYFSKEFLGDTSVVTDDKKEIRMELKSSYQQQLKEIQLIFNRASQDFVLKNLKYLRFSMTNIDSLSESTYEEYIKLYGKNIKADYYQKVFRIVKRSDYLNDFNDILLHHGLKVNEVYIDGLFFYEVQNKSKYVFDGLVIFRTSPVK